MTTDSAPDCILQYTGISAAMTQSVMVTSCKMMTSSVMKACFSVSLENTNFGVSFTNGVEQNWYFILSLKP
jgi:hypothetical protein